MIAVTEPPASKEEKKETPPLAAPAPAAAPAAPVPPPAPPVAPLSEREQNIIRVLEAELEAARARVATLEEALHRARISGGRRKNKINK